MIGNISFILDRKMKDTRFEENSLENCIHYTERAIDVEDNINILCILNDRLARLYLNMYEDDHSRYPEIIEKATKARDKAEALGLKWYPFKFNNKTYAVLTALNGLFKRAEKTYAEEEKE